MRGFLKVVIALILTVAIAAAGYAAYCFIFYSREGSGPLDVLGAAEKMFRSAPEEDEELTLVSWNIGFGAYESDYDFFMDGGKKSWAWSEERLRTNMESISSELASLDGDLYIVQEVDYDSTRTYHVDERNYLTAALPEMQYTFAKNYDSVFLCYPFNQPHGISRAGIMTFSAFPLEGAERAELPIESGVHKFFDLDRCYSKQRVKVDEKKELVLYNFHLSAYTSDGTIVNEQLKMLINDMTEEYEKGSYVIAGGDFNKDILGDSSVYFGVGDKEYTWAQPFPDYVLDGTDFSLIAPLNEEKPVPSSRNADAPYHEGQMVITIDGFMVSDNVSVESCEVIDTGFRYSDHNPVVMKFSFK